MPVVRAVSVSVEIVAISSSTDPAVSELRYDVHNPAGPKIWIVRDGWLIFRLADRRIELSYVRGKMRAGSHVFGYFPPAVAELNRGERLSTIARLAWPQPLDRLWNSERFAAPAPGPYDVRVRVGYGLTPAPEMPSDGEGVEDPVFRWQHEALSSAARMIVPEYTPTPDSLT